MWRGRSAGWIMAFAAAASLAVPAPALADAAPAEELQTILESQFQGSEDYPELEQYLQLEALKTAVQEQGFHVNTRLSLTPETVQALELQDAVPEGFYLKIGFEKDAEGKNSASSLGAGIGEASLLDLIWLTREDGTVMLYAPQIQDEAVGVLTGSLKEQYENSALRTLLDLDEDSDAEILSLLGLADEAFLSGAEETDAQESDIEVLETNRASEESDAEAPESDDVSAEPETEDKLADPVKLLEESISVEKAADGSEFIQSVPTQALETFYRDFMEENLARLDALETDAAAESEDSEDSETPGTDVQMAQEELQEFYDALYDCFGETMQIHYYIEDGLVSRISFAFAITDSMISEDEPEATETEAAAGAEDGTVGSAAAGAEDGTAGSAAAGAEDGTAGSAAAGAEDGTAGSAAAENTETEAALTEQVGEIRCELSFDEPEQPLRNFELSMTVEMEEETAGIIRIRKQDVEEGTVSGTDVTLSYEEDGSSLFETTIYRQTFDTATGDFDMAIGVSDPDSGEQSQLLLDSTFSDVAEGKGFTWTIDSLSVLEDGETAALTAVVNVDAGPDVNAASPQKVQMLLELDEEELNEFLSGLAENVSNWYYEAAASWILALPDTVTETEEEQETQSIEIEMAENAEVSGEAPEAEAGTEAGTLDILSSAEQETAALEILSSAEPETEALEILSDAEQEAGGGSDSEDIVILGGADEATGILVEETPEILVEE